MDKNISQLAALTKSALCLKESLTCCILKRLNPNKTWYKDAYGCMNFDHDYDDSLRDKREAHSGYDDDDNKNDDNA